MASDWDVNYLCSDTWSMLSDVYVITVKIDFNWWNATRWAFQRGGCCGLVSGMWPGRLNLGPLRLRCCDDQLSRDQGKGAARRNHGVSARQFWWRVVEWAFWVLELVLELCTWRGGTAIVGVRDAAWCAAVVEWGNGVGVSPFFFWVIWVNKSEAWRFYWPFGETDLSSTSVSTYGAVPFPTCIQ